MDWKGHSQDDVSQHEALKVSMRFIKNNYKNVQRYNTNYQTPHLHRSLQNSKFNLISW